MLNIPVGVCIKCIYFGSSKKKSVTTSTFLALLKNYWAKFLLWRIETYNFKREYVRNQSAYFIRTEKRSTLHMNHNWRNCFTGLHLAREKERTPAFLIAVVITNASYSLVFVFCFECTFFDKQTFLKRWVSWIFDQIV